MWVCDHTTGPHGSPGEMDEGLFRKVLLGISWRDYEAAVEAVPGAIGLSKSTVSREFKKATAAKLKEFQERDLSGYDVVALVLDGKSFAEDEMVVALGVTTKGDKVGARGSEVSLGRFLQDQLVQCQVRHCSLQAPVLALELLQVPCLAHLHPAVLPPPPVVRLLGDAELPADQLHGCGAGQTDLCLPQCSDDLLRSVSLPSHPDLLAEKLQTRSILTLHLVSFQGVRSPERLLKAYRSECKS